MFPFLHLSEILLKKLKQAVNQFFHRPCFIEPEQAVDRDVIQSGQLHQHVNTGLCRAQFIVGIGRTLHMNSLRDVVLGIAVQFPQTAQLLDKFLRTKAFVGLSTSYSAAIERGASFPRFDNLVAIINALGASADQIFADVIDNTYETMASILSEEIKDLPADEQRRILNLVETMVRDAKERQAEN